MSICTRCGAGFGCAMADGLDAPCWCTQLPPVVAVPETPAGCWCPDCLRRYIAGDTDPDEKVPTSPLK